MSKRTKCQVSVVFYTRDIGLYHIQSKPIPSIIKKNEINIVSTLLNRKSSTVVRYGNRGPIIFPSLFHTGLRPIKYN